MNANPTLLQIKYARIVNAFAKEANLSIDDALAVFYQSDVYRFVRDGVSDLHCMSVPYLVEELMQEYKESNTFHTQE